MISAATAVSNDQHNRIVTRRQSQEGVITFLERLKRMIQRLDKGFDPLAKPFFRLSAGLSKKEADILYRKELEDEAEETLKVRRGIERLQTNKGDDETIT